MAWGLLEDEDQLKLDPALADFVRQRTGAPPAMPPIDAAPMPAAGPSPQDAAAMAELEKKKFADGALLAMLFVSPEYILR